MKYKMDNLFFINPIGDHQVFEGWHEFLTLFFNYKVLCDFEYIGGNNDLSNNKIFYEQIGAHKTICLKTNFINIYINKHNFTKDDIHIIGDIFTNTLPYTIKKGKKLYYSEFFLDGKPIIIKIIFYIIGFIFFHNKKFILPHKLGYNTFKKISKKCLYFPILYNEDVCYSNKNTYETINLLFTGRIDAPVKNVSFLIDNFLQLRTIYSNLRLTLVGKITDKIFYDKYKIFFETGEIVHIKRIENRQELGAIYSNNDIFILPSIREPIGAVIQESMAHGCAIICSNLCGGACYIEEGENGYTFEVNNSKDFIQKISKLITDTNKLKQFKKRSTDIIKEKYYTKNRIIINNKINEIRNFINS